MDNRMDDHDALKYCKKDLYAKDWWESILLARMHQKFWLVDTMTMILFVANGRQSLF